MNSYHPDLINTARQFSNSRHGVDRTSSWGRQQQSHSAHQVDSWRSYSNDTNNLQQVAQLGSSHGHNGPIWTQQSQPFPNSHVLNPAAVPFQPMNSTYSGNPVQSYFTPYQPLRISNGHQERLNVHQARFNSTTSNTGGAGRYALRSRANTNQVSMLHNLPLDSIERQHISSVPINLRPRIGTGANGGRVASRGSPSATPPPAPSPSQQYLNQASQEPGTLTIPQKLLVVVDLNGTLLKRHPSNRTSFVLRPGVTNLMEYLLANHMVMVYTSSRPENALGMVSRLLSPKQRNQLVAVWARDKLDLTRAQYNAKVQTYKKLEKIWADANIQKTAGGGRSWDQSNTVLLDDSHLKGLAQPYNLLRVEEFRNDRPQTDASNGDIQDQAHLEALNVWSAEQQQVVDSVRTKLDMLKFSTDVSQMLRSWQSSDLENHGVLSDQTPDLEQTQLLTPKSPEPPFKPSNKKDYVYRVECEEKAELNRPEDRQAEDEDNISERSVSPIDESVWMDILGELKDHKDEPSHPNRAQD